MTIVSAIFLLVVLAALGAMMVTFSTVQHTTAAQDIQGARAYQAARAGVEWGLYQLLRTGTQPAPGCAASTPLPAGTFGGELAGFTVTVTCTAVGPFFDTEPPQTSIYTITSTATLGAAPGQIGYIERRLQVTAER